MSNYNRTIFMGRLGRDPDTHTFNDGTSVTTLSIGTSESWKDRNTGEKKSRTTWLKAKCFGRQSEVAAQYLKKGHLVQVDGRLETEEWTDKETGGKRSILVLRIDHVILMPNGGEREKRDEYAGGGQQTSQPEPDLLDDDIPF